MDDLETQLHRYADQIEDAVGEVTVAAGPVASPASARRSPLLLAAAAVAVLLIGAVALVLRGGTETAPPAGGEGESVDEVEVLESLPPEDLELVVVPDATALAVDDARSLLLSAGLVFVVEFEPNGEVPANRVFAQDPASGESVEPGTAVVLRVSSGAASTVPSVIGLPREEAISTLQGLGYQVAIFVTAQPQGTGLVIGQVPAPGATLVPGETVELSVSGGPEVVPVPDVEGLEVVSALNALSGAGFRIDPTQLAEPSAQIAEGRVVRTIPEANALLADGSLVAIVVSTGEGTIEVPLVTDLFADTAITTLRNQGLEVVTRFEVVPDGSVSVGRVLAQLPEPFDEVPVGTTVTITVGESAPVTTTTTP
ncbi:MAG: PASTA domain-containing protein [Actinomycetota bacterium]